MPEFTTKRNELFIDGRKVLAGWESFSGWYWFATEKSEERKVSDGGGSVFDGKTVDDTIWFGFVQGQVSEWGYFSEAEIRRLGPRAWRIKKCDLPFSGRRG